MFLFQLLADIWNLFLFVGEFLAFGRLLEKIWPVFVYRLATLAEILFEAAKSGVACVACQCSQCLSQNSGQLGMWPLWAGYISRIYPESTQELNQILGPFWFVYTAESTQDLKKV